MSKEEFITKFYSCDDEEQFLKDVYHNLNCLQQENQQLKKELECTIGIVEHNRKIYEHVLKERGLQIQISAREEEYRKLEDKLVETENWLRPTILQLMEIAKQDYFWITNQQIDNSKLVPLNFTVMGDKSVKFEKLERGVSDGQ